MKTLFLLLLFLLFAIEAFPQSGNFWQVLAEVRFDNTTDKNGIYC
jgi:hypothetical protein